MKITTGVQLGQVTAVKV